MEQEIVRPELFANQLTGERKSGSADHPVPLAVADMAESDAPVTQQLLEISFRLWIAESDLFREREARIAAIYDTEGTRIAACGLPDGEALNGLLQSLGIAACSVIERQQPETGQFAGSVSALRYHLAAVPVKNRSGDGVIAAFTAAIPESGADGPMLDLAQALSAHYRSCFYRSREYELVRDHLAQRRVLEKAAARRDLLFQSTKRLHDQIEVTSVLAEIVKCLDVLYPGAAAGLFLTQDYAGVDARVQPLRLGYDSDALCARSFLEGRPKSEATGNDSIRVAVPLSGKQAIYGVLELTMDVSQWEDGDEPDLILLAETAGTAFENAKLYEQSNLLIQELRLINELTKRLNRSLRLKEIYKFTAEELLKVFDAEFSCLLHYDKDRALFSVASCNVPAMENEQFSAEYGFCGVVYRSKEPLIVSDYAAANSVTSKLMEQTNAKSLIASPILVDGEVAAVILVAHRNANFFSYDNYKLLQVLSTHIGLAVTNASLHAEVRRMVITDNLTGLHARHYLDEQIQQRQRKDPYGSLILVDIDYFKQVNDTYGHQVGDRILTQVSDVIKSCIRETDIAARWGGEELAVYLPKVRTEQAFRIADRIRTRVASETDPVVTVSCGVSEWMFEDEKVSVESLFYRADMAMYGAKHNGRNRVYVG